MHFGELGSRNGFESRWVAKTIERLACVNRHLLDFLEETGLRCGLKRNCFGNGSVLNQSALCAILFRDGYDSERSEQMDSMATEHY